MRATRPICGLESDIEVEGIPGEMNYFTCGVALCTHYNRPTHAFPFRARRGKLLGKLE